MTRDKPRTQRVLALIPSTRGYGFAVLEENEVLVDWGVKSVYADKNHGSVINAEKMIVHFRPSILALHDFRHKHSRRSARVRELGERLVELAENHHVGVVLLSRKKIHDEFFLDGGGTKDALAELIAKRFPEELSFRLPPKRRPWMSEDYRMSIFEAVALAMVVFRLPDALGRSRGRLRSEGGIPCTDS